MHIDIEQYDSISTSLKPRFFTYYITEQHDCCVSGTYSSCEKFLFMH